MIEKKLDKEKVFRDPLYGYIRVEYQLISELIDTKEMQRLRRIMQLSGVKMVFHLAEHSRFSHSLGAYELARRVLAHVKDIKEVLSIRDQIMFLCTALLHDLGHGPYSHCFEHIFGVDHEEMTTQIILGSTEVNSILRKYDEKFPEDISSIILHKGKFPIIESLISSQLDVDRMDYLVRDSYFTGTPYGNIDIEKILRAMLIHDNRIVYKASASYTIENYIISRYHMYWQVYYHPIARSYEIMLEKICYRIIELIDNNYDFKLNIDILRRIKEKKMSLSDYIELDDTYINSIIKNLAYTSDDILSFLCENFLNRHLFDYADSELKDQKYVDSIKAYFEKNPQKKKYFYKEDSVKQIAYQYNMFAPEANDIMLLKPDGKAISLINYSQLVNSLIEGTKKEDTKIFYLNEGKF